MSQHGTKSNASGPLKPLAGASRPSRSIGATVLRLALIALCLPLLSACSTARSVTLTPPPANLAALCPMLPPPPSPAVDPDRLAWELTLLARYQDCATRHKLAVEAWQGAAAALGLTGLNGGRGGEARAARN